MQISDKLLCLFNAEVIEHEDGYHVSVPDQEIENGTLEPGEPYRVAVISRAEHADTPDESARSAPTGPQPPVEPGEVRYVEIEDIGKQGDGIARVERGYVIIVPGGEIDEQVKIEVTEVKSNFAVGEIIEDHLD